MQILNGLGLNHAPTHSLSVIIPCLNEEKTIHGVLNAIHGQTYPLDLIEVIIADGLSTDSTRQKIEQFNAAHPDLKVVVVDNPHRIIPKALNLAIAQSTAEIILRLDAHCIPEKTYLARSVSQLVNGKGKNVGGVWKIEPGAETEIARSIALAAAAPFAVGDAKYRYSKEAGSVDTIPFGCFYRQDLVTMGGYDESLLANEDSDLNTRIRKNGGDIWFDPEIQAVYFARPTWKALAIQYWRYGYWKVKMLRKYPDSIKLRQLLPPVFVGGLLSLLILGIAWPFFNLLFLIMVILYFMVLVLFSLPIAWKKKNWFSILGIPISTAVMHFSWGTGFLWSLFR